jgi:hypothetical protein
MEGFVSVRDGGKIRFRNFDLKKLSHGQAHAPLNSSFFDNALRYCENVFQTGVAEILISVI